MTTARRTEPSSSAAQSTPSACFHWLLDSASRWMPGNLSCSAWVEVTIMESPNAEISSPMGIVRSRSGNSSRAVSLAL